VSVVVLVLPVLSDPRPSSSRSGRTSSSEGEVGGDDNRASLVPQADDAEEKVGGAAVTRDVPELVDE